MSQSEFGIIQRHFVDSGLGFTKPEVLLGIGDDAALLDLPPGQLLAISMDTLVAGVHFPLTAAPAAIAYRGLAVNLSDLAAMAAKPLCFTLSLTLPQANTVWLDAFSKGLLQLAEKFDCPLVGGDTVKGNLSISIQVHGTVQQDRVLRRDGASVGDKIYVSGTVGDGAIALVSLGLDSHLGAKFVIHEVNNTEACRQYFTKAYYEPEPRIELARACAPSLTSCIDISDGLYGDLNHIVTASGVGARLNLESFPYSDAARCCMSADNRVQAALYGGDDYELCFTASPQQCKTLEAAAMKLNTKITCIGEIVHADGVVCVDAAGTELSTSVAAYDHFGND